jgi:transposase
MDARLGEEAMKIPRQSFTLEFKELAVKRVRDGERLAVVAKSLGLSDQTLRNWVKAADQGSLQGAGHPAVTPEQMEFSRLRAENLTLRRENDILKKAAAYFAKEAL